MNKNTSFRDNPIFICGHPKSGTTLLVSLLDSHPQMLVYPNETFFFRGFIPELRRRDLNEKVSLAQRYLIHFFERDNIHAESREKDASPRDQIFVDYAKTCEEMVHEVNKNGIRHDGDLLSAAVIAYAYVHGKVTDKTIYWIEKTPYNEHFSKSIFDWWPEAHCIHIVRDPRDNYLTYRRKHPGLSAEDFAIGWNSSLDAGIKNQTLYGDDRYLLIRYEDLTTQPEKYLPKVISFLGIEDDQNLWIPTSNGEPWEGNSQFGDKFYGISNKPVGRWKKDLDAESVEIIESICGELMIVEGYKVDQKSQLSSIYYLWRWRLKQIPALQRDISRLMKKRFGILPQ